MTSFWTRSRADVLDESTVDLDRQAREVAENRIEQAVAKVDAVLGRTKDRRQRDDLLDIRLSLTGRKTS